MGKRSESSPSDTNIRWSSIEHLGTRRLHQISIHLFQPMNESVVGVDPNIICSQTVGVIPLTGENVAQCVAVATNSHTGATIRCNYTEPVV